MTLAAPQLPSRFPCWCRATYSWGGETKRDLGFVEGDLIECLNAGDGSWWMGRLKRDRRMVGLFPSNFVELLSEDFRPTSPMPTRAAGGGSISRAASPQPPVQAQKKKAFRKPFTAYAAAGSPNPEATRRESLQNSGSALSTPSGSVRKSHKPFASMKRGSNERSSDGSTRSSVERLSENRLRPSSPMVPLRQPSNLSNLRAISPGPGSFSRMASPNPGMRAISPAPSRPLSRAASPTPRQLYDSQSRAASPMPAAFSDPDFHSRAPSPAAFPLHYQDVGSSPPPPPPPPHRVTYQPSRAPSPQPYSDDSVIRHTPSPHSPARSHFTPSPLTHAMNDVMTSLQDMTAGGAEASSDYDSDEGSEDKGIWSPEQFDEIYATSAKKSRPPFGVGMNDKPQDSGYGSVDEMNEDNGAPNVANYVQRMESRLRKMHEEQQDQQFLPQTNDMGPPPPRKNSPLEPIHRPQSSTSGPSQGSRLLRTRKSAYELGRAALNRTFTHKSSSTNATVSTNATHSTNHSLMSASSAGAVSATSAGSLARKRGIIGDDGSESGSGPPKVRPYSAMNFRNDKASTLGIGALTGSSDVSSPYASRSGAVSVMSFSGHMADGGPVLGGLSAPTPKKRGFFKKLVDSAKTGAASARSTINTANRPQSRAGTSMSGRMSAIPNGVTSLSGDTRIAQQSGIDAAMEMGLGGAGPVSSMDWVQVRRDVNRSNSISDNERAERAERTQMLDLPAFAPIDLLEEHAEGDEGLDGLPIHEPTNFGLAANLSLVDKSARFVANVPPTISVAGFTQGYLCRPYRSDVQRLRTIFTWVAERVAWEEDYNEHQQVDCRGVMLDRRGCSREIAHLVAEMCDSLGICAEPVQGYLKSPSDELTESLHQAQRMQPNHWWNAVIVDGEWRIMDCTLANSTFPRRSQYSNAPAQQADDFFFLARPLEACYTHVPLYDEQQHIVPRMDKDILLALPAACGPYFKHRVQLVDFDTSALFLDNLEMAQVAVETPDDIECVAEVEVREFARDVDGDYFESGDVLRTPGLCQPVWTGGRKRWVIKAVLPGDEGRGVLKIYGGKRGLMHSIKSNPHALCIALPIAHTGKNPPYTFFTRHPTPHAQRHDLYVAQPQCRNLVINNTFIFTIRQHPSSTTTSAPQSGGFSISRPASALGASIIRPTSAMSMQSASVAGSSFSNAVSNTSSGTNSSSGAGADAAGGSNSHKPAKLAIQSPSGKIMRVTRKMDAPVEGEGSVWETVIKVGERGVWRGLVLADRSARWCVFGEWDCS